MKSDYWEENGQVFVYMGKRYALNERCQTVCISKADKAPFQEPVQQAGEVIPIHLPAPQAIICDKLCIICGSIVAGKRTDRKLCSVRCRKIVSRSKQLLLV